MLDLKKELDQWGPIDGKIFFPSVWIEANAKHVLKPFKVAWPFYVGLFDHDKMVFYWEKEEMQKMAEVAINKYIQPTKKMRVLWKDYLNICQKMKSQAKRFRPDDPASPKIFYDLLVQFWALTLVPELANFGSPEYLRNKLRSIVILVHLDEVLEVLLAPAKLGFLQTSERELLRFFKQARSTKSLKQMLGNYAKKWYWVENSYFQNKVLGPEHFLRQLGYRSRQKNLLRLKELEGYEKQIARRKERVRKRFKIPRNLMSSARNAAFSIWWQDHRKAVAWWFQSYFDQINANAAKKFRMKLDDLYHYTAAEWLRLMTKGIRIPERLVDDRKKSAVVYVYPTKYKYFSGKKARVFISRLQRATRTAHSEQIKGIIASRGKNARIKGRVIILHSPRFASRMKPGDILVAPMTSPDYIVAMRKAKAIITDVGGLMSHAAVVSRELGVPCIVGTKIATKVLKDGMIVEVDANRGVVKIIK